MIWTWVPVGVAVEAPSCAEKAKVAGLALSREVPATLRLTYTVMESVGAPSTVMVNEPL
jgi:hypothetical protein